MTSASIPLAAHGSPKLLRTNRPLKLSRDLRNVPVERYRLEKDGRKWRVIARERMGLAEWLGTHGDGDGSRIFPSVKSMSRHFGWSRRKVFYLLEDLKTLGLLVREPDGHRGPLTKEHGTRIRRINLPAFLGAEVQDSRAEVQDSSASVGAEVQDSRAEVHSKVAHNRHLTDTRRVAGFGFESVTGTDGAKSSSSSRKDDDDSTLVPDWDPIERRIEDHKQDAETTLLRSGWDPHIASAALRFIEERSDHSGTIPSSSNYYLVAVDAAMADPRDKAKILERAERRRRVMPSDTELLLTARDLRRESETSRRPIKEILETRARAAAIASG